MDDRAGRTYAIAFLGEERPGERALTRPTVLRLGPDDDVRVIAESLRRAEADRLGDASLSAGLGGPRDAERSIQLVALHAEQAVRLGRAVHGPGRVTAFADLGPYCFVLGRPTAEIRSFCRTVLGPLADDAQRDELRTLEEFLRAHGSVNGVARALFLHRNTVRQRLKRIGQLTGADLEDADQRVQLYLAVLGQNALAQLAS